MLILMAENPRDRSEEVARLNRLSFPQVRSTLRSREIAGLENLRACLQRDFAIVTHLLARTPADFFDSGFESAILKTHFHVMSACFTLTRGRFRECAADALEEMLLVVTHFAGIMGERRAGVVGAAAGR